PNRHPHSPQTTSVPNGAHCTVRFLPHFPTPLLPCENTYGRQDQQPIPILFTRHPLIIHLQHPNSLTPFSEPSKRAIICPFTSLTSFKRLSAPVIDSTSCIHLYFPNPGTQSVYVGLFRSTLLPDRSCVIRCPYASNWHSKRFPRTVCMKQCRTTSPCYWYVELMERWTAASIVSSRTVFIDRVMDRSRSSALLT
ncbi:hypothetical protein K469DRAFT_776946, partial [Zopfia rhizophila CBS 207.26]